MKKVSYPPLFTELKRYFKTKGIKYFHLSRLIIVTEQHKKFPPLLFRFDPETDYIDFQNYPRRNITIGVKAETLDTLFKKLIKFKFLQS